MKTYIFLILMFILLGCETREDLLMQKYSNELFLMIDNRSISSVEALQKLKNLEMSINKINYAQPSFYNQYTIDAYMYSLLKLYVSKAYHEKKLKQYMEMQKSLDLARYYFLLTVIYSSSCPEFEDDFKYIFLTDQNLDSQYEGIK